MNTTNTQRRAFLGTLATGAAAGLTFVSNGLEAGISHLSPDLIKSRALHGADSVEKMLKETGKLQHAVAYDVSQANPWGFIWSNVYYMTNEATGTPPDQLGVMNVLRHHGIIFSMNDEVIKKYNMGEVLNYKDPTTNAFAVRNPYLNVKEGTFPVPGLEGLRGLQAKGARFCVCNMALQVYSGFVGEAAGIPAEEVYEDFISNQVPGVELAPSGVWVLGRLAHNNIAYIDSSVG